jgi:hypothetical protein
VRVVPPATDPEADLARLRRPTGPWLHLLDAAPADARQLGWLLGQEGAVVRTLRGHCGRTTYGLLDEVGAALQLPGDPAEDWSSLAALLTDMAWLPGDGHVLVVTTASLLLAAEPAGELHGFVEAVREVARGRAEEGEPVPFHVVLQDDAVGIAVLRERLSAVGARHAELSGWDAEEPVAEVSLGARTGYSPGDPRPDTVDDAVTVALSEVDGVAEVRRAWEEFRGPAQAPVRVYAPVLVAARHDVEVAAVLARASVGAGAACVVVPVPADESARDARQGAVAEASTVIWPVPAPPVADPAEPPATAAPGADGQGEAVAGSADGSGAGADRQEPVPGVDGRDEAVAGSADGSGAGADRREPVPGVDGRDAVPADAQDPLAPAAGSGGAGKAGVARTTGEPGTDRPDRTAGGAGKPGAVHPTARTAGERPEPPPDPPGDTPGTGFELVAANLEWTFDPGSAEPDAADRALADHVARSGRTAALHRSWVRDPDRGWVRVVLGYVGPRGSIADVETERTTLVDLLQEAGAGRCCVEVLAAADVSDVHRWLEERCRPLWPRPPAIPLTDAHPAHTVAAGAPAVAPARGTPPQPAALPADADLTPGPGAADPEHGDLVARLVSWAADRPGVVGLVTAWAVTAGPPPAPTLVVGLALDAAADTGPVRTEAAALAPGAVVEAFVPSRGLDPAQLRLMRSSSRVWTRRAERPERTAPSGGGGGGSPVIPSGPDVVALGPLPVRDTDEPRGDIRLDGGFTLVGIDRDVPVAKGSAEPDERDAALVDWARAQPTATALLRGVATVGEEEIPVYCVCVTEAVDPETARRDLAEAVAGTGTTRAAAEAFAPSAAISAFHLDLAVRSTRLWRAGD